MTLQSFSQTDTATNKKRIDSNKIIGLPDRVLRKAANDLVLGDGCLLELPKLKENVALLNWQLSFKDSIIGEKRSQIIDLTLINNSIEGKLENEQARYKNMESKYKSLKFNDRLKIGFFSVVIVALAYGFIVK